MLISVAAIDYSRPVQPMFRLPSQAGTIHSIFRRAVNIAFDDTVLALLSHNLPRMPNSVRLTAGVMERLAQSLQPGMEVWVGDGRLLIDECGFSLHLPETAPWEPRPEITAYRWQREVVAHHVQLLARYLADWPLQDGLAPLVEPLLVGQTMQDRFPVTPRAGASQALTGRLFEHGDNGDKCPQWRQVSPMETSVVAQGHHVTCWINPHSTGKSALYWRTGRRSLPTQPRSIPLDTMTPSAKPTLERACPHPGDAHAPTRYEQSVREMALPRLRMLARASWRQDIAGVEEATCGLAGLGPGLTPAGDDALAGFAAVMALLSSRLSADARPRDHIAEIIAGVARPRTTLLSGVLLTHAARGEVAEHLGELLLALALPAEASEVVLQAARSVLAFGATSGGDTLLGVLLGLRALIGEIDDNLYSE